MTGTCIRLWQDSGGHYVEAALATDQPILEVWVEAHRPVGHYHH